MSEYPKISSAPPNTGRARIDFSDRSFAQFVKPDGEKPYLYAMNQTSGYTEVRHLENNDIRAFAEEILRQFPETTPDPEPEYLIVIDDGNDEWVQLAAHPGEFALKSSYETRAAVSSYASEAYGLGRITEEYGVKAVRVVTGEEPV